MSRECGYRMDIIQLKKKILKEKFIKILINPLGAYAKNDFDVIQTYKCE